MHIIVRKQLSNNSTKWVEFIFNLKIIFLWWLPVLSSYLFHGCNNSDKDLQFMTAIERVIFREYRVLAVNCLVRYCWYYEEFVMIVKRWCFHVADTSRWELWEPWWLLQIWQTKSEFCWLHITIIYTHTHAPFEPVACDSKRPRLFHPNCSGLFTSHSSTLISLPSLSWPSPAYFLDIIHFGQFFCRLSTSTSWITDLYINT